MARKQRMIFDVGSGFDPKTDLLLKGKNVIHVDIDREAFHVEVQCDIHCLPFKDNTFDIVHASHSSKHALDFNARAHSNRRTIFVVNSDSDSEFISIK